MASGPNGWQAKSLLALVNLLIAIEIFSKIITKNLTKRKIFGGKFQSKKLGAGILLI